MKWRNEEWQYHNRDAVAEDIVASPVDWSRHFSCNQLHKTSDTAERLS
jgi:hypothetical protein